MEREKKFLDELSSGKPESFQEEVLEPVRKWPGRVVAVVALFLLVISAFLILTQAGRVTVPDMAKWKYEDLEAWAFKYHDNTILKGIYSGQTPKENVVSQTIAPGKRIGRKQSLTVTYSLGMDPEEVIGLPDIKEMTVSEVKSWIADNQLTSVTIKQEQNEIIPKDKVINYNLIDGTADEFQRKSRLTIYVSSGAPDMDEVFPMADFYGKTKTEVLQWAKSRQIQVKVTERFNQDTEYGKVYDQNIKKDTQITREDKIEVSISRGKSIIVPDYVGMDKSEAQELSKLLGINIFIQMVASSKRADTVIGQDRSAKTEVDQKQIVTIQIAKKEGKVVVPDFSGLSATEVNNLAALYGMKVFVKNQKEAGDNGIVMAQNISRGTMIDESTIVTLEMKKQEGSIPLPEFIGMTKSKALETARNMGIELIFDEKETMRAKGQTVLYQDKKPKEKLNPGDTLLLTIAVNSGIVAIDTLDMSLNEVKAWALQNGVILNTVECYSEEEPEGTLIKQDCKPGNYIPSGKNFTVYYSLGLVDVPDFTGKTRTDVLAWRDEVNKKGADISINFLSAAESSARKGIITDQSLKDEETERSTTINVWASASDQGAMIKKFEGMDIDDFKLWCEINSVPYKVKECYSDLYPKGTLYEQNYINTYLPEYTYLRINYSLGKVYLDDYTGKTKAELAAWQKDVNNKQGDLQIEYIYQYSFLYDKGIVVEQFEKEKEIDIGSKIKVIVSLGLIR